MAHPDIAAFNQAIEKYRPRLLGLVRRYVAEHEAEDVLQSAVERAWRAYPKFNERSTLYTWLYAVTRSAVLDYLRRRARYGRTFVPMPQDDEGEDIELPDDAPDPETQLVVRQVIGRVEVALTQMNPLHAEAFRLAVIEGYSASEIARKTHTLETTVRSRISRARRELRAQLAEPD